MFQDGASLVTHSQILSTFQDGGGVKFPTLGIILDVKIPTYMYFTKSNSPGLPDPPILGQTNDRCITHILPPLVCIKNLADQLIEYKPFGLRSVNALSACAFPFNKQFSLGFVNNQERGQHKMWTPLLDPF